MYAATAGGSESGKAKTPNAFFAMDTGTKDAEHQTAQAQAKLVKDLGYAGIGCDIGQMPAMREACNDAGLKLFAVYVGANVDPDKPKYDARLKDCIQSLKGCDAFIWLFIQGGNPSSTDRDDRAVKILREIADMAAKAGLRVSLYPHTNFYVERVEDAIRLAEKAGRKNVGVTFNLCHWLRVDKEENMVPLLKRAMPHLSLVTINGADSGGKGWNTLIQTLDRGSFDNYRLLKMLRELGYKGPVGLQHYGIKGSARENLKRSIDAWLDLEARLAAEK
jgi:sugar phosphate isomerase/epimerase